MFKSLESRYQMMWARLEGYHRDLTYAEATRDQEAILTARENIRLQGEAIERMAPKIVKKQVKLARKGK